MKLVEVGKSGTGFRFSQNRFPRSKMRFQKKIFLIITSSCHHELFDDTHPENMINCAKFHVCMPGIYGGIERQTHR